MGDVRAAKQFYVQQGLAVSKSFGRTYVEFATTGIKLALLGSDAGMFSDPDGFTWEQTVVSL